MVNFLEEVVEVSIELCQEFQRGSGQNFDYDQRPSAFSLHKFSMCFANHLDIIIRISSLIYDLKALRKRSLQRLPGGISIRPERALPDL